jgi:alpha-D-ribose 1-methylphosphonate 5-phosphate C-P lyase
MIKELEEAVGDRESTDQTGFLDEQTKKEIRRKLLKAVAIPAYQVPFGSREMPIARGWGTGGLQITLSIVGKDDRLKVIDQGSDESLNASSLRDFVAVTAGVNTTKDTLEATVVQTRHRIPEEKMSEDQILVFQVPNPDALKLVEASDKASRRMHAEQDYNKLWVYLYEDIVRSGKISISSRYPVVVGWRYVMDPTPIPRFDVPKLHQADTLFLFGAGREKRIYAVPPHTPVVPLQFEDFTFEVEDFSGKNCSLCGSSDSFLIEVKSSASASGEETSIQHACSDTAYCRKKRALRAGKEVRIGRKWHE